MNFAGYRTSLLVLCCLAMTAHADPGVPGSAGGTFPKEPGVARAVEHGITWLRGQQADDGGWHSSTYGTMKSGVGITALVLATLAESAAADDESTQKAFRRGITFLTANFDEGEPLRAPDGATDSPIYATALLLTALSRSPQVESKDLRQQLSRALRRAQQTDESGFPPEAPSHGGWTAWGRATFGGDSSSPANLSVTVHVLAALHRAGTLTPDCRSAALKFVTRCQNWKMDRDADGGFAFTPEPDSLFNKGGTFLALNGKLQGRSYHSATCDGIAALNYCGAADSNEQADAALLALSLLTPARLSEPSFDPPAANATPDGLFFYDAAALGRVWEQTHDARLAKQRLMALQTILKSQRPDGSWANPATFMREDDPLIATALAITALLRLGSGSEKN